MSDPGQADQPAERRQPKGCLTRGVGVVASICLLVVLATVAAFVFFPPAEQSRTRPGDTSDAEAHPAVGQKLPQLDLQNLTGTDQPVTLDDLTGKVVLVNFWGTWCRPCKAEAPHIAELGRKFGDRPDFKLLAVSCGAEFPEDVEKLRKQTEDFVQAVKTRDIPTYADPDFTTRNAFASLGGTSRFPTTFVMDRRGVIRRVWLGYKAGQDTEKDMQQWVARLLDEEA